MDNKSDVKPVMRCKGCPIISGYKTSVEGSDNILSLIEEMQKLEADVILQYNPKTRIFTILNDADMEESVFQEFRMFAKGFLKASDITVMEEQLCQRQN